MNKLNAGCEIDRFERPVTVVSDLVKADDRFFVGVIEVDEFEQADISSHEILLYLFNEMVELIVELLVDPFVEMLCIDGICISLHHFVRQVRCG